MSRSAIALSGLITILRDGRGLINHTSDSVFVSKYHLNGALDQDEVQYSIQSLRYVPYKRAKVLRVIKRSANTFIGRSYSAHQIIFVSLFPHQSKKIKLVNSKSSLIDFTVVKVNVVDWNERGEYAYAELKKIISLPDDPLADHLYIKNKYLSHRSILKDDKYLNNLDLNDLIKNQKHRINFCDLGTFSIDPDNAQDFDDAISIKFEKNIYTLIVHIADVSEFVSEKSPIDRSALQNGNSYYFPEKSYHMLPNDLATKFCSLVPGEKRLAVSICFKLTESGDIVNEYATQSVIKNKNRLSYDEVNEMLGSPNNSKLHRDISFLYDLHKQLRKKRMENGALSILNTEISFEYDAKGVPIKIIEKKQSESHSMVEECMLLANKYVAELLGSKSSLIYRNHDLPSKRSFLKIESLINAFSKRPKNLNDFISSIKSIQKRKVFSKLILKKLKRAKYGQTNIGHYGLSFDNYIHFTSPIRRYADLYCHRLLKEFLKNEKIDRSSSIDIVIGKINQNEDKAKNAENEYSRLKKLKFIQVNLKKTFLCTIESFSKKLIYVNINDVDFTAFIYKSYLKQDRYRVARDKHAIVGQYTKKTYRVGDSLKASIENIDMINLEVSLSLHDS